MSSEQLSIFSGEADAAKPAGASSSFSISKTINGSQQQVCDHWLIPVFVGEWMFGPKVQAEKIIKLDNTVRKKGEFDYRVNRRGKEIIHNGEYLELNIPNKLAFTWRESTHPKAECNITVQFAEEANKTKLKLNIRLPAELSANKEKIKSTWSNRCKALAEKFK